MPEINHWPRLDLVSPFLKVMSNVPFNANPIIYTSTKAHKAALPSKKSIWISDEDEEDESDEVEPIDQDEVFGA